MRLFLPALALLLFACGPSGSGADEAGNAPGRVERPRIGIDRSRAGTPAPTVAFEDPEGAPASLADFAGKPVLLNLWATWCAPCVKELPTLDALATREEGKLAVVTLSQDMEGRRKVEAFLAPRGLRAVDSWLDAEMKMMAALGVATLPTTILYDAAGREVWRFTGEEDWSGDEAAALIAEASR